MVKFALKKAQVRVNRNSSDFASATTYLGIVRGRYYFSNRWSVLGEVRQLTVKEAKDNKRGLLGAVEYKLTPNFQLGAGYNFTEFNDDLTRLDFQSKGLFFNMVGKF